MWSVVLSVLLAVRGFVRTRAALQIEILALRHRLIVKILTHLGLPARAPPRAAARPFLLFQAA